MDFVWAYGVGALAQADAAAVRVQVFVDEQGFALDVEKDGQDAECWHIVGYQDGKAVCAARMFREAKNNSPPDGEVYHVGRVAVLAQQRGRGTGRLLMQQIIAKARLLHAVKLTLGAQQDKAGFYLATGWHAVGQPYIEADYPHQGMEYIL